MALPGNYEVTRRFVSISTNGTVIWAVADDGTAWVRSQANGFTWQQVEPLPKATYQEPRYRGDDSERDR